MNIVTDNPQFRQWVSKGFSVMFFFSLSLSVIMLNEIIAGISESKTWSAYFSMP